MYQTAGLSSAGLSLSSASGYCWSLAFANPFLLETSRFLSLVLKRFLRLVAVRPLSKLLKRFHLGPFVW
jgi:hypothetical protein